jgi:hypothetical protein
MFPIHRPGQEFAQKTEPDRLVTVGLSYEAPVQDLTGRNSQYLLPGEIRNDMDQAKSCQMKTFTGNGGTAAKVWNDGSRCHPCAGGHP